MKVSLKFWMLAVAAAWLGSAVAHAAETETAEAADSPAAKLSLAEWRSLSPTAPNNEIWGVLETEWTN